MSNNFSYSLKFILDKNVVRNGNTHPVYAQILVNREKAMIALHLNVSPAKFNATTGRVMKPNKYENYLNNRLKDIESQINMAMFALQDEGLPVTAKAVKQRYLNGGKKEEIMLLSFIEVVINEMAAKPQEYSPHVVRHYAQCRDKLKLYLEAQNLEDIALEKFSRKHIDGFELFMLTTPSPTTGKPLCRNSANMALKKLKSVCNNAIRKELLLRNPFFGFKMVGVRSTRVPLSYEEICDIESHPLGNNMSLQKVRDIFLFSCFTGLRYHDAINLKEEDIKEDKNHRFWIVTKQQKTSKEIQIPMLGRAKVVYDRYESHRQETGFILPTISNQKLNAYLKQIALMVGINKPISHHVARHSYGTLLVNCGTDYKVVSELMGHYSIRSTEQYGKVTRTRLAKTADEVEAQLK